MERTDDPTNRCRRSSFRSLSLRLQVCVHPYMFQGSCPAHVAPGASAELHETDATTAPSFSDCKPIALNAQ